MKLLIVAMLVTTLSYAETYKPSSPPNAVSRGQSENSGISESPAGGLEEEREEVRSRSESMGGAPNAGGGMGTGTGAGSTVGQDVGDEGTLTAGSTSGEQAEE